MKISTRTTYGIKLLLHLAERWGDKHTLLKTISKKENISEKYLNQIVVLLKTAGLIKSFRGAHGGFELARPPERINLYQIVTVLEGGINTAEINRIEAEYNKITSVMNDIWLELEAKIKNYLENITLNNVQKLIEEKSGSGIIYNI